MIRRGTTTAARWAGGDERGSAVVDFALVGGLVTLVFAGVLQLTLAQHVRNTLVDCAAEGARYGALADHAADDGVERTRMLVDAALSPAYARDVTARRVVVDGVDVVEVRVVAPLPVAGLLGPAGSLTVVGHALAEAP
jgi:Flp pilus assembly pilin Flp